LRLIFSPQAADDLQDVRDYIARDKPRAARDFVLAIRERCQKLAQFPEIGAPRPYLGVGMRALPFRSYVIYYRVADIVRIERVLHSARDVEDL